MYIIEHNGGSNKMKSTLSLKLLNGLLLIVGIVSCSYGQKTSTIEKAVVKVFTSFNEPDYNHPWQKTGQQTVSGSGCIIPGNKILTSAHVVSNQTFIQVKRFGDPMKYIARVDVIGHECDLAILTVEDPEFFKNITPLALGKLPSLGDKVIVYGFPIGGEKLSITKGVVSRIEMGKYIHSKMNLLTIQIDAAINPGNSGGPVIKDRKIVGLAFQGLWYGENVGYIIPSPIIEHFLADVKDGKYDGFPKLGITLDTLDNPSYRAYLGMNKNQTGIVINQVAYDSSSWNLLKEGDVILSIDGIDIANDGTIPFGEQDRLGISYHLIQKYIGDKTKIKILRDKKIKEISLILKETVNLVPKYEYDVMPTYYIFGGLVFTKLSIQFLERMQGDYDLYNPSFVSLFYHTAKNIKKPDQKELIILKNVLADKINFGYHNYSNILIDNVDGVPVSSMEDLIDKINKTDSTYVQIGLGGNRKIILDREQCKKANPSILERYGIRSDKSEDLK